MARNSTFARLVARPVDRLHIAASTVPTSEALHAIEGFDVSPGDAALVAALLTAEPMSWAELRVPLRYAPEDRLRARLDECAANGVITFFDETIAFTPAGIDAALAVLDARATVLQEIWSNSSEKVEQLVALLAPVAAAAAAAGKPSSGLDQQTLRAPNPTPASQLWRMLAAVRRYRADCHAQAWAEAGYTTQGIVSLAKDASERRPIENRTNELNADIWAELLQDDQLRCMAALAALDGSGTPT